MLSPAFLDALKARFPDSLDDPAECLAYGFDNSRRVCRPEAVVFAGSTEDVVALVRLCHDHVVPLVPRGRGTGTAGGSLPEQGGVVLSLERMRRIVRVDVANRLMEVEPGVLNAEVQDAARAHGFFWPPDPSSGAYCSVGGNLATCAAGPRAVKYGVTRDHVLGLEAVTGTGAVIHCGGHASKNAVGYDLTRLLIGSEGTLAVVTRAILRLMPLPAATSGLSAHYRDVESCAAAITAIMGQPNVPSALEFLDAAALDLLRARHPALLPPQTRALLMIEVDGSAAAIAEAQEAILAACRNDGLLATRIEPDPQALWAARKALSPLLRDVAPKKINEDVAVPVSRLPELLRGIAELAGQYRVANVNFGHAGNGNIHVNLLVDPDDAEQLARAQACLDAVFDLVLRLDGTLSGEHGVGSEKRPFVPRQIDATTRRLMQDIKTVFDPRHILNPGKLFP